MMNWRSEWGGLYLPDQGPYFHNTKQDAVYGAAERAFSQLFMVDQIKDRLKRRDQRLQSGWDQAGLLANGPRSFVQELGQQGVGPVLAVAMQVSEQCLLVIVREFIAKMDNSHLVERDVRSCRGRCGRHCDEQSESHV